MAISADLTTIATSGDQGIEIRRRGQPGSRWLAYLPRREGIPLMLSPDGRCLISHDRMFDLTTDRMREFEKILGFSPDSAHVIWMSRRETGGWFHALPDAIQTAPLLHCLASYGIQYRLVATETSSGRIAAQSEWLNVNGERFLPPGQTGLIMENEGNGRMQMWQIPNRR